MDDPNEVTAYASSKFVSVRSSDFCVPDRFTKNIIDSFGKIDYYCILLCKNKAVYLQENPVFGTCVEDLVLRRGLLPADFSRSVSVDIL